MKDSIKAPKPIIIKKAITKAAKAKAKELDKPIVKRVKTEKIWHLIVADVFANPSIKRKELWLKYKSRLIPMKQLNFEFDCHWLGYNKIKKAAKNSIRMSEGKSLVRHTEDKARETDALIEAFSKVRMVKGIEHLTKMDKRIASAHTHLEAESDQVTEGSTTLSSHLSNMKQLSAIGSEVYGINNKEQEKVDNRTVNIHVLTKFKPEFNEVIDV